MYGRDDSGTPQPSSDTSIISNPCPNNRTIGGGEKESEYNFNGEIIGSVHGEEAQNSNKYIKNHHSQTHTTLHYTTTYF